MHEPNFVDLTRAMERGLRCLFLKDVAIIAFYSGISKNSKVLDAGPVPACFQSQWQRWQNQLFPMREINDSLVLQKEIPLLFGIKNIEFRNKDVYKGISEKELDAVVLDLPEPWKTPEAC